MKTSTMRVPRPADPLQQEIDRRLALKRAAGKREAVPPVSAGSAALRSLAVSIRSNIDKAREAFAANALGRW